MPDRETQEELNERGAPGWGATISLRQEPSRNTPTLRDDLTPPDPIIAFTNAAEPWEFNPAPDRLLWFGEGDRCPATFPPGDLERSVRCELRDGHLQEWPHSAQRSSV